MGCTLARTPHFALHCVALTAAAVAADGQPEPPTPAVSSGSTPVTVPQMSPARSVPQLFGSTGVWMGAMVPKRWAKRAVTRNAIRRQVYTLSALAEPDLQDAAHVVRLRAGFDKAKFVSATSDALKTAVRMELGQLFASAALSLKKKTAPSAGENGSQENGPQGSGSHKHGSHKIGSRISQRVELPEVPHVKHPMKSDTKKPKVMTRKLPQTLQ